MIASSAGPLAGRSCGACTVCCTAMAIDKPDIQKEAGVTCRYCRNGCTRYPEWPALCRDYFCGWRKLAILGEEWRPDRSGVLAEIVRDGDEEQLVLMLVTNPLRTVRQPWFVDFIARSVRSGVPLVLGIPGPPGREGAALPITTQQMWDAAGHSRARVKALLEEELKRLASYDFPPRLFRNRGHDFGRSDPDASAG